jgi:NADH:ubiquinone oxidoreductase subunit E
MFDQADEIMNEAMGARQNSERLLPLLELLQEQDGETSPIEELKGLLQAIARILKHQNEALQRIESACATAPPRSH